MVNKTIRNNVSWSFAEKILTEIVNSIITLVLARMIYPKEYGVVSIVQIYISILYTFVASGLGTSLIQNKEADEEQISTVFYLNIFVGILLYLVMFVFAPTISRIYKNNDLVLIIRILSLKLPVASIYHMQHSYIKKKKEFKKFFMSSLLGTILAGAIGIVLAEFGYGVWALVVSQLIDQVVDCIVLYLTTKWFPKLKINFRKTRNMIVFGADVLVTEMFSSIYSQSRSLIIGTKYTSESLAYNNKGQKFPNMINDVCNTSILRVTFPTFSDFQDDSEKMRDALHKCIQIIVFFLSPLMIGMAITANNFVPLLLTEKWMQVVPYIQIYCLVYTLNPILALYIQIVQVYGKGKIYMKLNVISISFELILVILSCFANDNPIYVAFSALPAAVFSILIYSKSVKRLSGYGIIQLLKDTLPSIISAIFMGIIVYALNMLVINLVLKLIIQVFLGAVAYFIISLIINRNVFLYIIKKK